MKPVRIPAALLTADAIQGLTLVCFEHPSGKNTPDGFVLDDWLKEHGIDVRHMSPSYTTMSLSTSWYTHLSLLYESPHRNFRSMLQMLYPFLPDVIGYDP